MVEKLTEIAVTLGSIFLLGIVAVKRLESVLDTNYESTQKLINEKVAVLDYQLNTSISRLNELSDDSAELKAKLDENTKVRQREIAEVGALKNAPVSTLVEAWNIKGADQ